MPGVFSVPKEGLYNVSVDELLDHAHKSRPPAPSQDEADEAYALQALKCLGDLQLPILFDLKGADGQPLLVGKGPAWNRLKSIIDRLPDGRERRMVIHKLRRAMAAHAAAERQRHDRADGMIDLLRHVEDGVNDLRAWEAGKLKLERPTDGTVLHKFRDAFALGHVFELKSVQATMAEADEKAWTEMAASAEVFVVEHNWAAAFRGATDYEFGEVHLPGECCAFEFRISGRSVIGFATEVDQTIYLQTATEAANGHWFIFEVSPHQAFGRTPVSPCVALVADQIRAIVIALDAAIAETTVIRAPHKLNAARERRGKLPIASYHTVSLTNRSRVPRLERETDEPPSHHKRLHFRRGHWRHYETWKTWIRWTLVGDPDLGFVDKHYRL